MTGKERSGRKVSVCIPTYNNEEETERLLKSLTEQLFRDYEVVVTDDSDGDGVWKKVKAFEIDNPDISVSYTRNTPKKGHIFNWNEAIRRASGEYIKIIFSDDFLTDEKSLGSFAALLDDHPGVDLAFSGSCQVLFSSADELHHLDEAKRKVTERAAEDSFIEALEHDWRQLFCGNEIGAPSAVIYRKSTGPALFDEKSGWASDMFLYMDILKNNPHFAFTKSPLISIGMHEGQYTESFGERDERIYKDYRYLYTKYGLKDMPVCRRYFMERYIMKYKKPMEEAKALGYTASEYREAKRKEMSATVKAFIGARLGKKGGGA